MDSERHSLAKSVILHLLPGVLILIFFVALAPILRGKGLPPVFTLFLAVAVVLVPFELGFLLYQARKAGSTFSLRGVVRYRETIPKWQYFAFIPPILIWALVCYLIIAPPAQAYIRREYFSWLPEWFLFDSEPTQYSKSALAATWVLGLLFNGVAGPIVEELYFRGYLLPRIAHLRGWAPLLNVVLFSVYHFFSPWRNLERILAMLPGIYLVQWKRNIYLGMIPHCLLNTTGMILMAPMLLR